MNDRPNDNSDDGAPGDSMSPGPHSAAEPQQPASLVPANSSHLVQDPKLQEIMLSDVGIEALLSRAKQSIFSCKEFGIFVKKLASIESDHSVQLKKTSRALMEAFKRPEIKVGTFQTEAIEIIRATDRIGDASNSYIDSMLRIHEELQELMKSIDRQRKATKETALRHEKNLLEAEQHAEKAKSKYDSTCEELERARSGDPGKKLGFNKKSEDELHKRMTIAEVDYQQKVDTAQRLRRELETKLRVESSQKLQSLILECDEALNFQVMRYANLSETLQLNRGFVVAPIRPKNSPSGNLSMKEMACKIDSQLDFYNYVLNVAKQRKQLNRPPITFKKHHSLAQLKQISQPTTFSHTMSGTESNNKPVNGQRDRQVSSASAWSQNTNTIIASGTAKTGPILGAPQQAKPQSQQPQQQQPQQQQPLPPQPPQVPAVTPNLHSQTPAGPRALLQHDLDPGLEPVSQQQKQQQQTQPSQAPVPGSVPGPIPGISTSESKGLPVFGTDLEQMLDYEEGTVPRIVYQSIQAVDNFGLEVESIYRANGNPVQIQEIKRLFDTDASSVDLLRPSAAVNDIHSVAGALKLYLRELPDPLLTREFHQEFMDAAIIDDEIRRRDTIHATVNKLPDPNYTTLRYLVFHLFRVQEREAVNHMSVTALGKVWGPVLMASDYANAGEMAVQGRVVETILINAYAIFEAE